MKERSQYYLFSFFGKKIQQKHVHAWDDFDIIGTRETVDKDHDAYIPTVIFD